MRGARDPEGAVQARAGRRDPEFTGVSSPYEAPEQPELVIHTDQGAIDDCLSELMAYVEREFAADR